MDKQTDINADGTKRALSNRHVQMIALGGTIGTALFLGASTSITKTGPSIIFVYMITGIFFFLMMRGMEMLYADPLSTRLSFISRYLGKRTGYLPDGPTGSTSSVLVWPTDCNCYYVQFWLPHALAG